MSRSFAPYMDGDRTIEIQFPGAGEVSDSIVAQLLDAAGRDLAVFYEPQDRTAGDRWTADDEQALQEAIRGIVREQLLDLDGEDRGRRFTLVFDPQRAQAGKESIAADA